MMKHKGTLTLETERVILRKFTFDDAEAMYNNWASDQKVTEFLRWQPEKDISEAKDVLQDWVDNYSDPGFYQWAIVLKETGEPIGSIGVVDKNEYLDIAHIGYCIGRKWWHCGYTSESFGAIIRFLFEEVGVNRIESQHDPNNPNSGLVMEKCGLKYEGTLRQADFNNKGIVDACMYSILKSEWCTQDCIEK